MYEQLKQIAKHILPNDWLMMAEVPLRKVNGIFYSGKTHQCNVCGAGLKKFVSLNIGGLLCPFCGSLSRHRRLLKELQQLDIRGKILHFSPARCLLRKLQKCATIQYITTDYAPNAHTDKQYDITNIAAPDNTYDFIICYHVLEHITEDAKAIKELFRVLKVGGQIIIQTPFKEGDIYENWNISTAADRKIHFGQEDHVRIYSVDGLIKRLQTGGFEISKITSNALSKEIIYKYGLKVKEMILLGTK